MADPASAAQQVAAAVAALHDPDPTQREAANSWLVAFADDEAAWAAGVSLLDPAYGPQLQFFGANMVLVKVRNAWKTLSPDMQQQLTNAVRRVSFPLSCSPPSLLDHDARFAQGFPGNLSGPLQGRARERILGM